MKPVFKVALTSFCLNLASYLLTLLHPAFLFLILFSLFIQTIIALDYIISGYNKPFGQGLLLSIGLLCLVGISVCTYNYQGMM